MPPDTLLPAQRFSIFLSYASEDLKIAMAIAKCLHEALGDFVDLSLDRWFLEAGPAFKQQIQSKLEKTDMLIIVYTGTEKTSHSFTGWEVGFFEGVMRSNPDREIVPMFLGRKPPTGEQLQGIELQVSPHLLQMRQEEFIASNVVDNNDPMCKFINKNLRKKVNKLRSQVGLPELELDDTHDPIPAVRNMRLAIFNYLKTTVEDVLKPQKQITIRTTSHALRSSEPDLPEDAKLIPIGAGQPMSIFGLNDQEMTWKEFLQSTSSAYRESWREAITSVVISSLPDQINVDNSQVILSKDESKTYRVILTTATKFWDESREFNLYFVETLYKREYGDQDTTLLLKGLELVCRYRFMFLENDSEFAASNILATRTEELTETAGDLLREFNLMRKESVNAGLNQPKIWRKFVDWDLIIEMGDTFRIREESLRVLLNEILKKRDQTAEQLQLRNRLSEALADLESCTRPQNARLIEAMATKLLHSVKAQDPEDGKHAGMATAAAHSAP